MPDITALRAQRPDVDERLTEFEELGRKRIAMMDDRGHCYGAQIAHEGVEALAMVPPGQQCSQCSRGKDCRDVHAFHPIGNKSCRLVLAPCPWCDADND